MEYTEIIIAFYKKHKDRILPIAAGLFVLIITICLVWYLTYQKDTFWKFLPENVVAVLQIPADKKVLTSQDSVVSLPGESLLPSSVSKKIHDARNILAVLDRINPLEKDISLHHISGEETALLFLVKFDEDSLQKLLSDRQIRSEWRMRRYKEVPILTKSTGSGTLSCYTFDNYIIGSFSSFLLEESIRTFLEESATLPNKEMLDESNSVLLTVNTKNLHNWMNSMLQKPVSVFYPALSYAPDYLQLNLDLTANDLIGSGNYFFNKDEITPSKQANTNQLYWNTASENMMYYKALRLDADDNYSKIFLENELISERINLLKERFNFDYEAFSEQIEGNVQQFILDKPGFYQPYKIINIPIKDSVAVTSLLSVLHPEEERNLNGFTKISQPDFPRLFIPEGMSKFPATYYKVEQNSLWLANQYIPENVLRKITQRTADSKAFYTYYINGKKFISFLQNDIKTAYKKDLSNTFSKLGKLLLEIDQDSVHLQLSLQSADLAAIIPDTLSVTPLPEKASKAARVVINHYTQQKEFILQDEKTRLMLLSDSGEMLWRNAVWQHTVGDVSQVDVYNNEKLQYAFISDGKIHVYDRLGRKVNGFPMNLPTYFEAKYLLPVRLKNDKEQRFLVAGVIPGKTVKKDARLYLFNRYGGIARSWNPRKLESALATPPVYLEENGKVYILTLLENGSLYALDQNARVHPGFPLLMNFTCHQPLVISKSGDETLVNIMSDGGDLVTLDLSGSLRSRKKMRKIVTDSRFFIVGNDANSSEYQSKIQRLNATMKPEFILMRQDEDIIHFFNTSQQLMFKFTFPDKDEKQVQLLNFGPGKVFINVFSPKSKSSWIFNTAGKLMFGKAIKSDAPVTLTYLPQEQIFRLLVIESRKTNLLQFRM